MKHLLFLKQTQNLDYSVGVPKVAGIMRACPGQFLHLGSADSKHPWTEFRSLCIGW